MIHSVRFTVVLDTNVIYPVIIRDLLFWFAHYEMYTPKWSKHIFDEWMNVMRRRGVSSEEIEKRVQLAAKAFPDALVKHYEGDYTKLKDKFFKGKTVQDIAFSIADFRLPIINY